MTIQINGYPAADKGKTRKAIRKKVLEILLGNTAAGSSVFTNASIPPGHDELPVILIYPKSEPASEYAIAPKELERVLDLVIEIIATGPEENALVGTPEGADTSLEDVLDDLAEEVEALMSVDDSLQGTADDSILSNTEFEFDDSGGSPIGSCRLTYSITYFTHSPRTSTGQVDPDHDLETHNIEYNIGDDENTREADDTVTIP